MREVIFVGTKELKNFDNIKSLIVNEIHLCEIAPDALDGVDSLIFTSKNAILSLSESAKNAPKLASWTQIPSFVIGQGSAKALREAGAIVEMVGHDSHGVSFANELIEYFKAPDCKFKRPLFLRAKKIISHLDEQLIAGGVGLKTCIAYANEPKKLDKKLKPSSNGVLIFTAPSAYHSFKENFGWDGGYVAVAIGMTTFSAFDSDVVAFVSEEHSVKACVELALDLAQKMP